MYKATEIMFTNDKERNGESLFTTEGEKPEIPGAACQGSHRFG